MCRSGSSKIRRNGPGLKPYRVHVKPPCSVHNSARHSPFKLPDGFSGHPCPFSGVCPSAASFGNDRFPLPPDYPAMAAVARPAATRLESIRCDRKSNPTLLRRERRTVSRRWRQGGISTRTHIRLCVIVLIDSGRKEEGVEEEGVR